MDDDWIERYAGLLAGSPVSLMSSGERQRAAVHIREGLALADCLPLAPGSRWLDLGTGGGLPGLPLAAAVPETRWMLVDATRRKVEEVNRFITELGIENAETRWARAEELAHEPAVREHFDGVVSRALAPLVTVAELSRGFCRPEGLIAAVKGPAWHKERERLERVARALGIRDISAVEIHAARPTWVVMMRTVGPAPAGIPRRAGLPKHKPL